MTTTPQLATEGTVDKGSLSDRAADHLWMHFTRHSTYESSAVPVIVRGEGPYIWDDKGKRYLDGLSGLFVVQAGHGRVELAEAAARQAVGAGVLPALVLRAPEARSSWPSGWPTLAPGDLNRIFFTTGGGEAVESAWKLAKQYFKLHRPAAQAQGDQPRRSPTTARRMGALSITGIPALKEPFEPLVPGAFHVANTNLYRRARARRRRRGLRPVGRRPDRAIAIVNEGPDTVAAVFLEPVQNAGGCFPPPAGYFAAGARDLRPLRRAARVRRGDLRVRPAGPHVRLPTATATSPTSSPARRASPRATRRSAP